MGDPVSETVTLEFLPNTWIRPAFGESGDASLPETGGRVRIEAQVDFHRYMVPENNALVARRLNDRREALMNGHDPWHVRFDRVFEPVADGAEWRRDGRDLTSYRRWALTADPYTALRDFFVDTPMQPVFEVRDNEPRLPDQRRPPPRTVTLAFVFTGGTRATAGESTTVSRGVHAFAADAARYQRRLAALWRYMDENPGRRFETLRGLFAAADGDELPESRLIAPPQQLAPPALPARRDVEKPLRLRGMEIHLIEQVVETGEALLEIFDVPDGDSFTLQELSRRVFDPFPGVVVAVPDGVVIEAIGFVEGGDGYRIPSLDLWSAYRLLDGLFVSPDPLVFLFESQGDDFGCGPDDDVCYESGRVSAFLDRGPLTTSPGAPARIRQALEAGLRPLDEYRLVWTRSADDEAGGKDAADGIRTGGALGR